MALAISSSVLRFLDIEIDAARETIRRAGEEIRLRQKSFQVLLYLIEHRDRVVTKEELFSAIWGGSAVTEDALVQCIVEIRKAVGDDPREARFIRTVPKRGYHFVAPDHTGSHTLPEPASLTIEIESTRLVEYERDDDDRPLLDRRMWRAGLVAAAAGVAIMVGAGFWRSLPVARASADAAPPASPQPRLRTGDLSFSSGLTENLEAYRLYSIGVDRASQLRPEEAIHLFERALLLDPEFAMAEARIGYVHGLVKGETEPARRHLAAALKMSHRLSERDGEVIAAWQSIVDSNFDDAIERFRLLIERYPTDLESHVRLARLLSAEERIGEALALIQRAAMIDPNSPDVHNMAGGLYMMQGRHAEALAAHRRYVSLRPGEANAYDSLGLGQHWAGQYEDALASFGRALQIDPRFNVARYHRAATLVQLGRFTEAVADLDASLAYAANDNERGRVFGTMSDVYSLKGDERRAVDAFRRGPAGTAWVPTFLIGRVMVWPMEKVQHHLRAYIARGGRPERRGEFFVRSREALRNGDADTAVALMRDSLRFRPLIWYVDSFETGLGDLYLELGRNAEARNEYTRVLTINPNYARALYGRARAHAALGQASEARADFERFLRLWKDADRDARDLIDARRRLAKL